jgi:hypothetical protein
MSAVKTHEECWYSQTLTVVPTKENITLNLKENFTLTTRTQLPT